MNRALPRMVEQDQGVRLRPPVAPCAERKEQRIGSAVRSRDDVKWQYGWGSQYMLGSNGSA